MHPNDVYRFIDASNFRICESEGLKLWQDTVTANTTSSWQLDYGINTTSDYIGWFPQEVTSNIAWGGGWSDKGYTITLRGNFLNSEPKDEIPDPEYSFEEMMEIEEAQKGE